MARVPTRLPLSTCARSLLRGALDHTPHIPTDPSLHDELAARRCGQKRNFPTNYLRAKRSHRGPLTLQPIRQSRVAYPVAMRTGRGTRDLEQGLKVVGAWAPIYRPSSIAY